MHCIFPLVYGLINNSSLNICLLKTILSVVFMDDKIETEKTKYLLFKAHSISNEMLQIYGV